MAQETTAFAASAGQRGSGNHSGPLSRAFLLHELLLVLSVRLSAIGSEVSGIRVWGLFEPQDLSLLYRFQFLDL